MLRNWAIISVLAGLIFEGIVSGVWTQRWVTSSNLEALTNSAQLPPIVGEWDGRDQPVSAGDLRVAQATAISRRTYVNNRTGNGVSVMLICGRGGPVTVHTPEVCFPSQGYEQVGKRLPLKFGTNDRDHFWHAVFKPTYVGTSPLSVCYAWSDGGDWQAPDAPRLAFAGRSALLKLYVVSEKNDDSDSELDSATRDLMQSLLPQLRITLSKLNLVR